MKVGSLVELVQDFSLHLKFTFLNFNMDYPVKKKVYTVRDIEENNVDTGKTCITLEEIVNNKITIGNRCEEPGFGIEHFREVQPPMEIAIEELMEEPQLV